jgi:hypothetical protein
MVGSILFVTFLILKSDNLDLYSCFCCIGSGALIDVRAETLHGSECRWLFGAIGKMFAKCVIDGLVLGVRFNRLFLSWLTGKIFYLTRSTTWINFHSQSIKCILTSMFAAKPPSLDDLHAMDASMYRGLTWVLENDVTDMDLTFSASFDILGAQQTISLVTNGESKTVTESNKREYVDLMMTWLIRGRFEPAVSHFVSSFHSVLPVSLFEHFSLNDLQLLLSGSPEVDINSLREEACYTGGYGEATPQVQWFWDILKQDLSGEEVSALLAFITGCPCVPHSGLKPPLTLTMIENVNATSDHDKETNVNQSEANEMRDSVLPRSHTCFHQIVLPLYSCKEKMLEKVLYALKNSDGGGFHLA